MSVDDASSRAHRADPLRIANGIAMLDVEPDLGRDLSGPALEEARRHAVLPAVTLEPGPWTKDDLRAADGVRGDVHGFLLVEGALTMNVSIADRSCARFVTPRELVLLDGLVSESVPATWGWSALERSRLAVLDERLLLIARRWPSLLAALLKRAAQQTSQTLLQQAISQLPRVEDRLLMLFWSIADRQGVVRGDGIWVRLPVTHDTIARMIGARRPTVSLGLSRLAEQNLLRAVDDGWLIDRTSMDRLGDGSISPAEAESGTSEDILDLDDA